MVSKFYLFAPVVKEIIKTYVENGQSLIMEGCYIPFGREKDFADDYQCDIKYICLIFSEEYIRQHFADIVKNESVIETRLSTDITADDMIKSNGYNLEQCKLRNYNYIFIDHVYQINHDIIETLLFYYYSLSPLLFFSSCCGSIVPYLSLCHCSLNQSAIGFLFIVRFSLLSSSGSFSTLKTSSFTSKFRLCCSEFTAAFHSLLLDYKSFGHFP